MSRILSIMRAASLLRCGQIGRWILLKIRKEDYLDAIPDKNFKNELDSILLVRCWTTSTYTSLLRLLNEIYLQKDKWAEVSWIREETCTLYGQQEIEEKYAWMVKQFWCVYCVWVVITEAITSIAALHFTVKSNIDNVRIHIWSRALFSRAKSNDNLGKTQTRTRTRLGDCETDQARQILDSHMSDNGPRMDYSDMLKKLSQPSPWTTANEAVCRPSAYTITRTAHALSISNATSLGSLCHWKALTEPYVYITSNPGKEIRTRMIAAFDAWLRVPSEKLTIIAKVVSMLHSASLL